MYLFNIYLKHKNCARDWGYSGKLDKRDFPAIKDCNVRKEEVEIKKDKEIV